MKYTYCEKLLWFMMAETDMKFLKDKHPDWNISELKSKTKVRYKELISELPDIGDMMKNSLRISLSGGALWMAIYESTPEPMTEAEFEEMVPYTLLNSPMMKAVFSKQKLFGQKELQKKIRGAKRDNAASNSEFSWQREIIPGRDDDEITTVYTRCGLCALGKKEGHPELVKYMCAMDIVSIDLMGGILDRTKTLATGGDCCDFRCIRKGSHWERELARKDR